MKSISLTTIDATVSIPDVKLSLMILHQHAIYDSLVYRPNNDDDHLRYFVEESFNYIDVTVDGESRGWYIDFLGRYRREGTSIDHVALLSIRNSFIRKSGHEYTYDRYLYLHCNPELGTLKPTQSYAHVTSDIEYGWGEVIDLLGG